MTEAVFAEEAAWRAGKGGGNRGEAVARGASRLAAVSWGAGGGEKQVHKRRERVSQCQRREPVMRCRRKREEPLGHWTRKRGISIGDFGFQ